MTGCLHAASELEDFIYGTRAKVLATVLKMKRYTAAYVFIAYGTDGSVLVRHF